MNLSTNLVRRKEELEAVKLSSDNDALQTEAELKKQDLMDAESSVHRLTQELKSETSSSSSKFNLRQLNLPHLNIVTSSAGVTESIDDRNRKMDDIKAEKDKLKVILVLYSSDSIIM